MNKEKKICPICKKCFFPKEKNQVYCGRLPCKKKVHEFTKYHRIFGIGRI